MDWSLEKKVRAAIEAPLAPTFLRDDTRVVAREGWYQIVTPSAHPGSLNEVAISRVDARDADRVIEETIAEYRACGQPTKWCVGPWTEPADFGDRLTRRGFESWDVRGMGVHTSAPMAASSRAVAEAVSPATLADYVTTNRLGWGGDESMDAGEHSRMLRTLAARPQRGFLFLVRIDGQPVGTAALALRDDYAYLLGTQVLERARGRGAYRALVAARLAFLRERGVEYAVTHAREATSAPMLEHLGFETLFRSKCFLLPRA